MSMTDNVPLFHVEPAPVAPKPFLKWIGGKTQLLPRLRDRYPEGLATGEVTTYVEPFIGGGAVFFDVMGTYGASIERSVINDINPNLVNAYRVIRDDFSGLVSTLKDMKADYMGKDAEARAQTYYAHRESYNKLILDDVDANNVDRAALLIFLNKTCFNGLYRVNNAGKFNAAHGRYENPLIVDEANMKSVSACLQNTEILLGSYKGTASWANQKNTFVYLDPPYRPLTKTAKFSSYDVSVFGDTAQEELGDYVRDADIAGAKILLSNSDPKNIDPDDNFFDDLYSDLVVDRVPARRSVSCKATTRSKINEVLVSNY